MRTRCSPRSAEGYLVAVDEARRAAVAADIARSPVDKGFDLLRGPYGA